MSGTGKLALGTLLSLLVAACAAPAAADCGAHRSGGRHRGGAVRWRAAERARA